MLLSNFLHFNLNKKVAATEGCNFYILILLCIINQKGPSLFSKGLFFRHKD